MLSWPELAPGRRVTPAAGGTDPLPWAPGTLGAVVEIPAPPPAPRLEELEREWARKAQEAREEGIAEGLRLGRQEAAGEGAARVESALQALSVATAACLEEREQWNRTLSENLAALALAAARHLVEQQVKDDPSVVSHLVRRALTSFPPDQRLRVRLNPEDLSAITARGPEGQTLVPRGREVEWVADAAILRGGCMVEGPESVVDGRVDTALERIYWRLAE